MRGGGPLYGQQLNASEFNCCHLSQITEDTGEPSVCACLGIIPLHARQLPDKLSDALGPVQTHDTEVTASQRALQPVGLAH